MIIDYATQNIVAVKISTHYLVVLKHPNGLGLYIIVKNNVVVEAYLCS